MIDVFCIGTPNVVGDAIGPLVGSMLSTHDLDVNIVGTLESPVVTNNYHEQLSRLRDGALVIAVDACIGENVMTFEISEKPINPGAALHRGLEPVGDITVRCYTGSTVHEVINADSWDIVLLAYRIVHRLKDLIRTTQNKGIYSNVI